MCGGKQGQRKHLSGASVRPRSSKQILTGSSLKNSTVRLDSDWSR